jgi:hypothetical protein
MTKPRLSQIDQSGAAVGDVAMWDGTEWVPAVVQTDDPLFADDGSGALLLDDGSGWLYPDSGAPTSGGSSPTLAEEILADSPWSYWPLDDASGATMADASGNARDGAYVGTPTLAQPSIVAADTSGTAVLFPGTAGTYAEKTSAAFPGGTAFTVEFWVQPVALRAAGSPDGLFTCASGTGADGDIWMRSGDTGLAQGQLDCAVGGGAHVQPSSPLLAVGVTTHLALTYDGTTYRLYFDGTEVGSATVSTTISSSFIRFPWNYTDGRQINGYYQHVATYTTALSAARIAAHFAAG